MKSKLHIVPHGGDWAVRVSGSPEPASIHATQEKAIEEAMNVAKDEELDIVVHRRDGSFRNIIGFDVIERRQAESRSLAHKQLLLGILAAGAFSALAVRLILNQPLTVRRFFH